MPPLPPAAGGGPGLSVGLSKSVASAAAAGSSGNGGLMRPPPARPPGGSGGGMLVGSGAKGAGGGLSEDDADMLKGEATSFISLTWQPGLCWDPSAMTHCF